MRDECLRVAASFQAAPPSIVPGARTSGGAGVGSAVFPPVDTAPPPVGSVQTPYQPVPPVAYPYGAGTPGAPVPPSPVYGYPQQPGYQTPTTASPYGPQQTSTPPPHNISPQSPPYGTGPVGGPSGGRNDKPVIIGSVVVAVVSVVGLLAALLMNNDGGGDDRGSGGGTRVSVTTSSWATYNDLKLIGAFPAVGTGADPRRMPETRLSVSTGNPPSS
jgi:hypothetical protein